MITINVPRHILIRAESIVSRPQSSSPFVLVRSAYREGGWKASECVGVFAHALPWNRPKRRRARL